MELVPIVTFATVAAIPTRYELVDGLIACLVSVEVETLGRGVVGCIEHATLSKAPLGGSSGSRRGDWDAVRQLHIKKEGTKVVAAFCEASC